MNGNGKVCKKCGTEIMGNPAFCTNCGELFDWVESSRQTSNGMSTQNSASAQNNMHAQNGASVQRNNQNAAQTVVTEKLDAESGVIRFCGNCGTIAKPGAVLCDKCDSIITWGDIDSAPGYDALQMLEQKAKARKKRINMKIIIALIISYVIAALGIVVNMGDNDVEREKAETKLESNEVKPIAEFKVDSNSNIISDNSKDNNKSNIINDNSKNDSSSDTKADTSKTVEHEFHQVIGGSYDGKSYKNEYLGVKINRPPGWIDQTKASQSIETGENVSIEFAMASLYEEMMAVYIEELSNVESLEGLNVKAGVQYLIESVADDMEKETQQEAEVIDVGEVTLGNGTYYAYEAHGKIVYKMYGTLVEKDGKCFFARIMIAGNDNEKLDGYLSYIEAY